MTQPDLSNTIEKHLDDICSEWSSAVSTEPILHKLNASKEQHQERIARPVLLHLLSILRHEKEPGDCPVIRDVVETFYLSGLTVEDVFLHCTSLKNSIIDLLFEYLFSRDKRTELAAVLDANLYYVISLYTQKQRAQESRHKLYSQIIEEHIAMTATDTKGAITYVTDAFCELSGYPKNELVGTTHALLRHADMKTTFFEALWKQILSGKTWKGKIKNRTKDGGEFIAKTEIIPVKDEEGTVTEYLAIRHDITEKELSAYDPLTGLYNRRAFDRQMRKAMASHMTLSLMLIDLDHFKRVNDTFGHTVGDRVLKKCAAIIADSLAEFDIAARWGGEEFVVLLPNSPGKNTALIAEGIRQKFAKAALLDPETPLNGAHPAATELFKITCSVGVTQHQKHDSPENFFDRADRNLYKAKQAGRNTVVAE